jgi:4-amino-4-deoxy-L-arabinose transferase-like glycosyltransferase
MKIKKEYFFLAGIFIIAVGVRIGKFNTPDLVMDTVAYSRLGKNLIEFGRYTFGENYNMGIFFPPGYPVFIGLINLVFNDLFFSAKLVSFVASCISIFLAYLVGKELYDVKSGLFAALLFAIYPVVILVSVQGYSDALFILFLLLSIYLFMVSLKTDKIIICVLLGLAAAMTFYMRPEGVFILLLPFSQLFGAFSNKLFFNKKYLSKMAVIFLIFILGVFPYMLFLKNYTGKFTLSGKGNVSMILGEFGGENEYHKIVNAPDNLYDRAAFSLNDDKTRLRAWGKEINFSMKDYVMKDPVVFLKKYQKNVLQEIQVLIKLLIPVILPLFFSFFYRGLFADRRRLIFLLFPVILFLIYPSFIIIEKQTFLIVVFLLVFASGGFSNSDLVISDLATYYSVSKNKGLVLLEKSIKPIIIAVLIITSLSYLKYSRFQHFDPAHARPGEHIRAGYFLREKFSPDYEELNIMGRKPYVSYYSDSRFTMIPYASINDVINFARLYNVDYIVVDERSLSKWDAYDELVELHKHSRYVDIAYEDNSEKLIKLFKINKK